MQIYIGLANWGPGKEIADSFVLNREYSEVAGMFSSKYRELTPDSADVAGAAECLKVTEFRLFEMAYRDWYGHAARETELEREYIQFWCTGVAPSWVRHYCRQVVGLQRQLGHDVRVVSVPRAGATAIDLITLASLAMSMLLLLVVI